MTASQFDLIFRGDVVPGHRVEDVKLRLAKLFKVDPARIEALFSGKPVALKRNLNRDTAEKYQAVLLQAGAQVRLRPQQGGGGATPSRPAAGAVRKAPSEAPKRTDAPQAAPESGSGQGFSLAPPGANLLTPAKAAGAPEPELDLSALSVRPAQGDLLDESEKSKDAALTLDLSAYKLAEPGTDLLEGYHRDELPLMEPMAEFDLAEPGADVLRPEERQGREVVDVDVSHLQVAPLPE
ncbi:hypothetical protein ACXYTJ_08990 [Gilvimarinus sp. F26214L]|uniref:hypothetical protein n=1 Tax=Gilvimarinus sp. DZF01 TaxID=3461371 RepID=UPI0040461A9C